LPLSVDARAAIEGSHLGAISRTGYLAASGFGGRIEPLRSCFVVVSPPLTGSPAIVGSVANPLRPARWPPAIIIEEKGGIRYRKVFRVMAHSPEMLEAFLALNGTLPKTKLDGKFRELAYIKTSELNQCDYCLHHHRTLVKKAGLNDRQVSETLDFEESDAYDDLQRDVMRYAEQATRHIHVDVSLFARLEKTLGDRELVELAMTVGIANFNNRVTETLRMELP
jgi:AhpD family alkylhydroperoxidase